MVKPPGLPKKSKRPPPRLPKPGPAPAKGQTDPDSTPGETEKLILAAARKEFIAKGLDGARMQAIAADAGVNKALLHYYYRSKDRLYRTVLEDTLQSVWGRLQVEMRSHGPGDGVESMVRTLVSTYLRTLTVNPDLPLFMVREMASGGAVFHSVFRELGAPFGEIPARLFGALKAEMKAGTVKPTHPVHFFINVMGMSLATFLTRPIVEKMAPQMGVAMDFGGQYLEDRIQSIVDMAMNGIRTRRG